MSNNQYIEKPNITDIFIESMKPSKYGRHEGSFSVVFVTLLLHKSNLILD